MSRERWGTFSVRDHTIDQPFVTDVLLYDRLIIPRPPEESRNAWADVGWDPDRLDAVLDVLGADSADPAKRRAIAVTWDDEAERIFNQRAEAARIVTLQEQFQLSRRLLTYELLPAPPGGRKPASVVAAYPSGEAVNKDWVEGRRDRLTLAIGQRFLTPVPRPGASLETLKEAVALANDVDFQKKRAKMYDWQERVLREDNPQEQALDEMEDHIEQYNAAIQKAMKDVYLRFAFTLVPVTTGFFNAHCVPLAAVSAVASLVHFWVYDRQPKVDTGPSEAAAMFHDAREKLDFMSEIG